MSVREAWISPKGEAWKTRTTPSRTSSRQREERRHGFRAVAQLAEELEQRQRARLLQPFEDLADLVADREAEMADLHGRGVGEPVALGDLAESLDEVEQGDLQRFAVRGGGHRGLRTRPEAGAQRIDLVEGLGGLLEPLVLLEAPDEVAPRVFLRRARERAAGACGT